MHAEEKPGKSQRRDALGTVVATYEGPLLRYAARLTGNPAAAEDVVQNAFIKLIRNWHDALAPSPPLSAWLYRVVHNEAVDHVRREVRRQALHDGHAREPRDELAEAPLPDGAPPDRAAAAVAALQRLPERDRQLVVLKVYEQKSYREMAEITGLSVGNVGFILHHAMRKLAEILRTELRDGNAES